MAMRLSRIKVVPDFHEDQLVYKLRQVPLRNSYESDLWNRTVIMLLIGNLLATDGIFNAIRLRFILSLVCL